MKAAITRSFGTAGLAIPRTRLGVATNSAASPTGMTSYATRTWDSKGGTATVCLAKNLAPSSGVYDWASLDGLLAGNPGSLVHVCLGCPPDWMVSRAAVGGSTAYGGKSNMVPDDLDAYAEFVRQMALRIKNAGFVVEWDTWNEVNGAPFYNEGAWTRLGPYVRAVAAAIRSVTPDAQVNAPNTNQDFSVLAAVLATSDGAGGTIANHCNGASFHYYHDRRCIPELATAMEKIVSNCRAVIPASWNVSLNEAGIELANPRAGMIHAVRAAVCASLGVNYVGYTSDHLTYGMSGYAATWNAVAGVLCDSTLTACYLDHGQSLVVETSKGRATIRASGVTLG